jgi:serine/threonine-protein kinase
VLSSDPGEGEQVDEGSAVDLRVSAGKADVVVKYVVGLSKVEATRVLRDLGLNVDYRVQDSDQPKNQVLATDPNAGESVKAGSTVTLVLSRGQVQVPNVVGFTEDAARQRLQDAGFVVNVDFDPDTPSQKGIVLDQTPTGRTDAPRGSRVTIVVSSYEEPTPSPSPSTTRPSSPSTSPSPSQPSPSESSATTPAAGEPPATSATTGATSTG